MARFHLALALTALLLANFALSQPAPTPAPAAAASPPPGDGRRPKKDWKPDHDNDHGPRDADSDHRPPLPPLDDQGQPPRFKKWIDQMSPDERQRFQDNWKRWKEMGDDERKNWQQRAMDERERVKKIIDDTISKLGLNLDADQREVFVLRYRQERRKIEEQLRKEFDDRREAEVNGMLQRLKAEFSKPAAAATPAPEAPKPSATP